MKSLIAIIISPLLLSALLQAQKIRNDDRTQILKEDSNDYYLSDQVSKLDILRALEISGIRINKFQLGNFEEKYKLSLQIDEYLDGKQVKTNTVFEDDNQYHYYLEGESDYYLDYIDQIKIFTQTEEGKVTLFVDTYKFKTKKEIVVKKADEKQFFIWRNYSNTKWKLDEKVPLMIYASSWKDKEHGFQRFCGVVNLSLNEERTQELLSNSPNYFVISYLVTKLEEK